VDSTSGDVLVHIRFQAKIWGQEQRDQGDLVGMLSPVGCVSQLV